jgi:ribonuclease HI
MTLEIYTDGSASPNPGIGGAGAVFIKDGKLQRKMIYKGGETTNIRMELMGVIMVFKHINKDEKTIIYTDCSYVHQGINEWIKKWEKNNWKTATRKDVKNKDLWIKLKNRIDEYTNVEIKWTKAHNGHKWNDLADALAKKGSHLN